jgi:thioester reductase-like protein
VLGRAVSPSEPLGAALDSLGAAALLEALSGALGRTIPLRDWFAADSLASLAARLEGGAGLPEPSLRTAAQRELQRPLSLAPGRARTTRSISRVLLTGVTGFLGVHLLESLLMRSPWEVLCLVRASDREEGEARLRGACLRHGIKAPWMRRVRVVPGDLSAPGLGLSSRAEEAEVAVDAVVHAGAEVSWLAPYEKLRGANVDGTRAVLELASRCGARVHLVSTISAAPADREEDGSLTLEQAAASSPYVLSKWLSEQLARSALARGLPLDISRPGMIAPHSKRASGNAGDFLHRYLLGCLALGLFLDLPGQRLDFTPVDFVADAIVALLQEPLQAGATHHLVNVDQSPTYRQLGLALQRAGAPVTPASYEQFRAALLGDAGKRAPELRALGAFFPEGGAPGMGPWPSHRSQARLAALGVRCPAIDEAYLRRWLRAVAREQGGGPAPP